MKEETFYKHCLLYNNKHNTSQYSWIPQQFAVQYNVVKLKVNGVWDDGWIIVEVCSGLVSENQLPKGI